ncbi:MAG: PfkB family carbohydrate kinase [Planctomycetota bacterium]|nr:PfkB family carbohydrate kinase [Planctomycetota bacterium]
MSLVVVGSVAFDSIETPDGSVQNALGGSAVHFSLAASLFGPVQLVGVVGEDFPEDRHQLLRNRGICTAGLEVIPGGETFRWSGKYFDDMDQRETLTCDLNVFEKFKPEIPAAYRDTGFLFLGNGAPVTQSSVLNQMNSAPFTMVDTMNFWIHQDRSELVELLGKVDALVLNDEEAYLLTQEKNLVRAGRKIREMGPRFVIAKKGQHGATIFHEDGEMALPALPLADVVDPTGAGDSFAGGLMGSLQRSNRTDLEAIKVAVAWGTITASFCCGGYGVDGILEADRSALRERFDHYRKMLDLGSVEIPLASH